MRGRPSLESTAIVLAVALGPTLVLAQSRHPAVRPAGTNATRPSSAAPSTASQGGVDSIVRHGVELRTQGRDDEALAEFQRAYAIDPTPRVLAQIALAEQALGHWLDADEHLRASTSAATDAWIQRNRSALDNARTVIDQHIGRLDLRGGVNGAEVRIGNRAVATLPLHEPIRVVAGSVSIEVRAPGYVPLTRVVVVSPNGLSREDVELTPSPTLIASTSPGPRSMTLATVPASSASTRTTPPPASPLVWVGGGALLVGAIGTLVVGLVGNGIQDRYRTDCGSTSGPTAACGPNRFANDQSTLDTLSLSGDVFIGLAATGAVLLGVGLFQGIRGRAPRRERAMNTPTVLFGGRSLGVRWTW